MHYVLSVTHKPGSVQADSEMFAAFAGYLRDHPGHPGIVVHHAGPTRNDGSDAIVGSLLIVEASSSDEANAFLADSPYGKAGIFSDIQIRQLEWRYGRPE